MAKKRGQGEEAVNTNPTKEEATAKRKRTRGQGEGTIFQLPNGTWCAKITTGKDENGKQKRKAL